MQCVGALNKALNFTSVLCCRFSVKCFMSSVVRDGVEWCVVYQEKGCMSVCVM